MSSDRDRLNTMLTVLEKVVSEFVLFLGEATVEKCGSQNVYDWTQQQKVLGTALRDRLRGGTDYSLNTDEIVLLLGLEKSMKTWGWQLRSQLTPNDLKVYEEFCKVLFAQHCGDYKVNFGKQRVEKDV